MTMFGGKQRPDSYQPPSLGYPMGIPPEASPMVPPGFPSGVPIEYAPKYPRGLEVGQALICQPWRASEVPSPSSALARSVYIPARVVHRTAPPHWGEPPWGPPWGGTPRRPPLLLGW